MIRLVPGGCGSASPGRLTLIAVVPSTAKSRSLPATNRPMSCWASSVDPPMCGVRMTLGEPAQLGDEFVAASLRFHGKHVDRRPRDRAGLDAGTQRRIVDDEAAGQVEEQRARLHAVELPLAEHALVGRPSVHVQGDDVGLGEQVGQRRAAARVAQRKPVGGVEEEHLHAEVLGEDGELGADVAVADDPERAAADLVRPVGRLVPDTGVHQLVLLGEPARHRDDLGDRELDH